MLLRRVAWCAVAVGGMIAVSAHAADSGNQEPAGRGGAGDGLDVGTVAPLDVLYPADFLTLGYTSLPQILANLLPGLVYPEPALAHGTDHTRPVALRGLAPDQMVVLLNGKRRTTAAWLHQDDTYGRGSVGVDLSIIPVGAVKRIEVLRDGGSARYGSGAIAGVVNVVLKDAAEGGSLVATFGQYRTHFSGVPDLSEFAPVSPSEFFLFERGDLNTDDGEGDTRTFSAHGGFTLFDRGFLDISAEFRDQEATNRSGHDPRRVYPDLPNGDWDPREAFVDRRTHRYGNPTQEDVKLLVNFGLPVSERTDFYGHVGYSARNAESAELFVPARSAANVIEVHPDGYLPLLDSNDENRYFSFGLRGERWRWDWDFSFTQDEHEMDLELHDSLNPALGGISPTNFSVGNYEGRHALVSLDLSRGFDVGLSGPLIVDWGLELRDAEYENEFGDRASYVAQGAVTDAGELRPPGSQGLYGVRPVDGFDDSLTNVGAYLQLEAPVTPALDTVLAVRVDDEEDNTDVSARLAARWRLTERFSVRGAVSRDFRSPSAAQTHFLATELVVADGGYREQGTYPVYHPVAEALGAAPLDSETALNLTAGARFQLNDAAALSFDVYRIDLDDRIVLSNYLSGDEVSALLAAEGFTGNEAVRYFFNGVDTRTRGVDVSGDYRWRSPWGPIELRAGFNLSDTDITGAADAPAALAGLGPGADRFGALEQTQLETWTPDSKLHLSARWQGERLTLDARLLRYGEVTDIGPTPEQDLELGSQWLLDLQARYRLTERGYASFGVHNMLDEYTDVRPREDSDPVLNRVLPYSNYAPFGFNGRFVYLRLGIDLDD